MTTTQKPNVADAYSLAACQINDYVQDLDAMADTLHDVDPDNLNWGHVGDLARVKSMLEEAAKLMTQITTGQTK